MPGLLIKDFPPELHRKLKEEAARHHRSMTRQALFLLEKALSAESGNAAELLPEPIRPARPLAAEDRLEELELNAMADARLNDGKKPVRIKLDEL